MPLVVASRALELAQRIMQDVEAVCHYIPEAEFAVHASKKTEPYAEFSVGAGARLQTVVRTYSPEELEIKIQNSTGTYELAVPEMYAGPHSLPIISFSEKLYSKRRQNITMHDDTMYGSTDIMRCWRIATVAATAMSDIRFRLQTGRWPAQV